MTELRCIHRHTINEHPTCFVDGEVNPRQAMQIFKETGKPWHLLEDYRIGYFDIESDGLKADFATMLSWCIKERDGDIYYDVISKKDFTDGIYDQRIIKSAIDTMNKFRIITTYYGCVTPGHKILKSDLSWVNVETLKAGDELLAFDEETKKGYRTRQFTKSVVKNNIPVVREVFEIKLNNGEVLKATEDHPWLVQLGRGTRGDITGYWVWRTTRQLMDNMKSPGYPVFMTRILDVWEEDNSYEAGYVAGFFDGEGCISHSLRKGRQNHHYNFQVSASQNSSLNKDIVDRVSAYLNKLGFNYSLSNYDKSSPDQINIGIVGGSKQKLKFLGVLNLAKNNKLDLEKIGRISNSGKIRVVSIESIGEQIVCGLETSSKTYIANGFGSHNTKYDIPFLRSKALHYGIEFPEYGSVYHYDVYYTVKAKLCLSRNSLDAACDYLNIEGKTPLSRNVWRKAKYGDKDALLSVLEHNKYDVIILEELHKKLESSRKWMKRSV